MTKPDPRRLTRRRFLKGMGAVAMGSGLVMGSQFNERNNIVVERHTLRLPNWDAGGFRLGVIGDFHADNEWLEETAIRGIALAGAERPDALVVVGDVISHRDHETPDRLKRIGAAFGEVGVPVYVVPGNHEYRVHGPEDVLRMIEWMPVTLLRNQTVEQDGVRLWGLDDAILARYRPDTLDARHDKNVVALLHEPDMVADMPDRVSLQVSGHSHGGQICLPGGIPIAGGYGCRKYRRGYYPNAERPLYVNRGLGSPGVQFRSFCAPEVTVLTLNSA